MPHTWTNFRKRLRVLITICLVMFDIWNYKPFTLPPTNTILPEYGLDPEQFHIKPYGTGLINHTWRIINSHEEYILQRINNKVFEQPQDIAFNISHYRTVL